jgi:hypoxanthine phosphoribosyltransferase
MVLQVSDVMISSDEIESMCDRLGEQISRDYKGKELLLVGVLKGSFVFMADLIRRLDLDCRVDFMKVSSYRTGMTPGELRIVQDLEESISGRHVLIVEDIIDSGRTLLRLVELLQTRNPASLKIVAAFDKPERREVDLKVDYVGMQIPDEFIVGYGLDYAGLYRNFKDIRYMEDI